MTAQRWRASNSEAAQPSSTRWTHRQCGKGPTEWDRGRRRMMRVGCGALSRGVTPWGRVHWRAQVERRFKGRGHVGN
ncbi:hypothetical protein IG631_17909 [Alternaria alternata]|nr:hypothetical protein IG631_17909 [Alternaria alternata]